MSRQHPRKSADASFGHDTAAAPPAEHKLDERVAMLQCVIQTKPRKNWEVAEGVTIKVGATAATRSRRGWSMRHWLAEKQIASAQRDIRTRDRLARAVRIAHPHVRRCAEHG